MAISEARHKANEKYNSKAYDEIKLRVTKGKKAELQEHAKNQGESLNSFINRAIDETIARDGEKAAPVKHKQTAKQNNKKVGTLNDLSDENELKRIDKIWEEIL